jgi:hypothetical protein
MKASKKEKLLTIALLKERLERVSGKKVMFKEAVRRVSIEEMNRILSALPPGTKVALKMVTKPKLNKNIIDETGAKVPNPYFDKVVKKNTVYGTLNWNYSEDKTAAMTSAGQLQPGETYTPKRSMGEKEGAIVRTTDNRFRLPMKEVEYDTPVYEINGNEISKEELQPYLPPKKPGEAAPGSFNMIAPYMENVKTIAVGNDEYQIML